MLSYSYTLEHLPVLENVIPGAAPRLSLNITETGPKACSRGERNDASLGSRQV